MAIPSEKSEGIEEVLKTLNPTGIDRRTVRDYVYLIAHIQNSPRIKLETIGLRVFVRREK